MSQLLCSNCMKNSADTIFKGDSLCNDCYKIKKSEKPVRAVIRGVKRYG